MKSVPHIFGELIEVSSQEKIFSVFLEDEDYEACCSALETINVDEEIKSTICSKVMDHVNVFIRNFANEIVASNFLEDLKFLNLLTLAAKLPECVNLIEQQVRNDLADFIDINRKFLFNNITPEEFSTLFSVNSKAVERRLGEEKYSMLFAQVLLDILSKLFEIRDDNEKFELEDLSLSKLLLVLCVSEDSKIAEMSASCLKWCLPKLMRQCEQDVELDTKVWKLVRFTITSAQPEHVLRNSYIFWLRSLGTALFGKSFQEFIRKNEYWKLVQLGLASDLHDLRKFSLSILKVSLKYISGEGSVDTELLKLDASSDHLESWRRFTTLYEIVAIDTALNQYEAASSDILGLFEASNIHPSWGLIIFSTGLKASMESVRKFTVKLILQVKNKEIFCHNPIELKSVFIPALMQASFFNVVDSKCSYGEKFAAFVAELIMYSKDKKMIVFTVLQTVYETRSSFDAARVYLALGVLRALETLREKLLLTEHILIIKKLFMTESEDEILQTTIQTIYLKYLLHSDVAPFQLIDLLTYHVKTGENGYKYISGLLDTLRDFCTVNFDKTCVQFPTLDDPISEALSYQLFDLEPDELSDKFLVETAKMNGAYGEIAEEYYSFLSELLAGDVPDYKDSKCIIDLDIFTPSLFSALKLDKLYESIFKSFEPSRFDLFVALYTKSMQSTAQTELNFADLLDLYSIIETHNAAMKGKSFKYRDGIYANYFCLLKVLLESRFVENEQIKTVLNMMRQNFEVSNGYYKGNLSIVNLCCMLLQRYVVPSVKPMTENENHIVTFIFCLLRDIWDSLNQERLVLNQQPLHLALIEGMFDPAMFCYAVNDENMMVSLTECGKVALERSFSRRSFKPLMSRKFYNFMSLHGDCLPSNACSALISLLTDIFVHEQMKLNIFKLKPVIAKIFDDELRIFVNGGLYKKVYGEEESMSRVYIVSSVLVASNSFRSELLHYMVEKDENFLSAKKKTDGSEEIERLLKWQLALLTIRSIQAEKLTSICCRYIIPSLKDESSPLVRIYLEWFIAYDICQARCAGFSATTENAIFEIWDHHCKPVLDISAERTLYLVIRALRHSKGHEDLLERYLPNLVAGCTSNKPLIRHFSNSLILSFWPAFNDIIEEKTLKSIIEKLYIESKKSQVLGQFRAGDANLWDLHADLNLTSIFGGVLFKVTDHEVPYLSASMFKKFQAEQALFEIGDDEKELWLNKRSTAVVNDHQNLQNSPLQKKSGAWDVIMDFENEKSLESVKRSQLIVVASLVDKAPNLGGICRLCDVLGVGTMTVHDIRMKQHPQFKNVAVTADRWMPIEQVPVDDIILYMHQKKREGYTLIGLEQTDSSIELNSEYRFPSKSLILLGTEAHGIPGHLLSELDLCLEIKQSGVIRSMNIQTATAVIVYSYSVQHL